MGIYIGWVDEKTVHAYRVVTELGALHLQLVPGIMLK